MGILYLNTHSEKGSKFIWSIRVHICKCETSRSYYGEHKDSHLMGGGIYSVVWLANVLLVVTSLMSYDNGVRTHHRLTIL
jgi:hypothetical protein